ncbi:MAG: AAA family ATPase [Scytolyngbya sp. HA4215-MV1]|nr:AAA family ATPase [Scytolyngbya sp. HA4215-MV1]
MMGVSGSGKTLVGRRLAERLECDYWEGDRRHSPANLARMLAQQPLEDDDRQQWLQTIVTEIQWAVERNREIVIACSALKTAYRQQLTASGRVQLIWLDVPANIIRQRLAQRLNHYMKAEMLNSQIATFESITSEEKVICVNGQLPPDDVVRELMSQITDRYPALQQPWWARK